MDQSLVLCRSCPMESSGFEDFLGPTVDVPRFLLSYRKLNNMKYRRIDVINIQLSSIFSHSSSRVVQMWISLFLVFLNAHLSTIVPLNFSRFCSSERAHRRVRNDFICVLFIGFDSSIHYTFFIFKQFPF